MIHINDDEEEDGKELEVKKATAKVEEFVVGKTGRATKRKNIVETRVYGTFG